MGNTKNPRCSFCDEEGTGGQTFVQKRDLFICPSCIRASVEAISSQSDREFYYVHEALSEHFAGCRSDEILTFTRLFPDHMRADVQLALADTLSRYHGRFFGFHEQYRYEAATYASLMSKGQYANRISAAQYIEIDTGDDDPIQCLENGLWLLSEGDTRFAVVLGIKIQPGSELEIRIEVVVPSGEKPAKLVARVFELITNLVSAAKSYRGKILSFEMNDGYSGMTSGLKVHKLPNVETQDLVLPIETIELLQKNVVRFARQRAKLLEAGMATRKGLLLYGPPGTGKTHSIKYLASCLAEHTTLLISAEQIGLLGSYMKLARLLQPAIVVIEDADLIARNREDMSGPCEEILLNKLLNEMDGLKDEADILFLLTTNRPEQLETALAGRPGRIDQAIEIPLPDTGCRAKLIELYKAKLKISKELVEAAVARTEGVSAAFIKELMRRVAQNVIERDGDIVVEKGDLDDALDDMMFRGGTLNLSLLGVAA